jgi:hypothetical protein
LMKRLHVRVVEDDETLRELLTQVLTILPPPLQVKGAAGAGGAPIGSTRSYSVDTRVIAATNKNLENAIKDGSLRQDLFHRLNVVRIHVAPLHERRPDVPALVTAFMRQFNQRFSREIKGIAPDAMAALLARRPGAYRGRRGQGARRRAISLSLGSPWPWPTGRPCR